MGRFPKFPVYPVYVDYETGSMTGILKQLKWESLKKRRKDRRLIMLYKGLKGAASIPTNDLVPPIRRTRNHHSLAFRIPMAGTDIYKSRKENPQKLTQLSSRSHPRHLVGKRTAQKDTIIDITSDSQVNSNFPYRWTPASLTFNNYFYLFLYLYIT